MSTDVFTFTPMISLKEGGATSTLSYEISQGFEQRRKMWSTKKLVVSNVELLFPPNVATTFVNFFDDRDGAYDTFLYKPFLEALHKSVTEDLGTGDGITTSFPMDFQYVDDTDLSVSIGGVVTTGGTLTNNNVAPRIVFATAPGATQVTATYGYKYPVRFNEDSYSFEFHNWGGSDTSSRMSVSTALIQDNPGSHIV